jgi:hypothetical protein
MQEGIDKPRPKVEWIVGELVRVKEGPFTDFNGAVEDVNYEKSKVGVGHDLRPCHGRGTGLRAGRKGLSFSPRVARPTRAEWALTLREPNQLTRSCAEAPVSSGV